MTTDKALAALRMFVERITANGEWDEGCFYYHGTSASELQEPLRLAKSVLENSPAGLADAHSKSPSRPAMPKEEDTHG